MGTSYAFWAGFGAVGTAAVGLMFYGEAANPARILLILGIVACIVGLNSFPGIEAGFQSWWRSAVSPAVGKTLGPKGRHSGLHPDAVLKIDVGHVGMMNRLSMRTHEPLPMAPSPMAQATIAATSLGLLHARRGQDVASQYDHTSVDCALLAWAWFKSRSALDQHHFRPPIKHDRRPMQFIQLCTAQVRVEPELEVTLGCLGASAERRKTIECQYSILQDALLLRRLMTVSVPPKFFCRAGFADYRPAM